MSFGPDAEELTVQVIPLKCYGWIAPDRPIVTAVTAVSLCNCYECVECEVPFPPGVECRHMCCFCAASLNDFAVLPDAMSVAGTRQNPEQMGL